MSNLVNFSETFVRKSNRTPYDFQTAIETPNVVDYRTLAAFITKTASKQTYYTIHFFVDRPLIHDAYRAYAYFRWVDDMLDTTLLTKEERGAFLQRQQMLIDCAYHNQPISPGCDEENILAELIRNNPQPSTGLEQYIRNMMAVMAIDVERRGSLISQQQLTEYSQHLSTAVTEALHFFIGHNHSTPQLTTRYLAVTGAHITHMLRDTYEDVAGGYFNISREFLSAHQLDPSDIQNVAYQEWVKSRVRLARTYFNSGKRYLAQIANLRCRFAGYAYIARFEQVLNLIEKDKYRLRPDYSERKSLPSALRMSSLIFSMMLKDFIGDHS